MLFRSRIRKQVLPTAQTILTYRKKACLFCMQKAAMTIISLVQIGAQHNVLNITAVVITKYRTNGAPILTYDKVHLFTPTAEHEVFAAGDAPPPIVESSLGRLSGVICYDLRFGELFSRFVGAGVEWVVCPAQWPVARALHWEGLVRGRAVESQAVVVACNRTGVETIGRSAKQLEFGGNSLIVDGHGQVLGAGRGQAGAVIASIDRQAQQQLRVRVPVRKDRRPDLYQEWLNPD